MCDVRLVLVGDGELQEGQNWEACMSAVNFGLRDLIVIVDENGVQLDGTTDEIMPMLDIAKKLDAFGFDVHGCDGHSCRAVYTAVSWAVQGGDKPGAPKAVIAKTVKEKGVSFMEGKNTWHGAKITDDLYEVAKKDLAG
jgi:transketolase